MERRVSDVALSMQFAPPASVPPCVHSILAAVGHGPRIGSGAGRRRKELSREDGDPDRRAWAMNLVKDLTRPDSRGIDDLLRRADAARRPAARAARLRASCHSTNPWRGRRGLARALSPCSMNAAALAVILVISDLEAGADAFSYRHLHEGVARMNDLTPHAGRPAWRRCHHRVVSHRSAQSRCGRRTQSRAASARPERSSMPREVQRRGQVHQVRNCAAIRSPSSRLSPFLRRPHRCRCAGRDDSGRTHGGRWSWRARSTWTGDQPTRRSGPAEGHVPH